MHCVFQSVVPLMLIYSQSAHDPLFSVSQRTASFAVNDAPHELISASVWEQTFGNATLHQPFSQHVKKKRETLKAPGFPKKYKLTG